MRSVLCVLLSLCLTAAPLFAQPGAQPPAPAPAPAPAPSPEPEHESFSRLVGPHLSAGLAFLSAGDARLNPGVGLELGLGVRLDPRVAINLSFDWGFTEFARTAEWWSAATRLGSATTDGYKNVTDWAGGCDDKYIAFCFFGAFVAYAVLLVGYAGSGVMYVTGPFASTGFVGLDLTGSYAFGAESRGLRLELGASAMALFPQQADEPIAAVGPTLGLVSRVGRLRLGGRVAWFPPVFQLDGRTDRSALVGLLSLGTEY